MDDRADLSAVDYYALLGVAPTSEDVVIRAAYHALMRRYHPDANGSARAAERARGLTVAYSVLSDPERRAEYDALRAGQARLALRRRRPPGFFFALGSGAALVAALGAFFGPPPVTLPDLDWSIGGRAPRAASAPAEAADAGAPQVATAGVKEAERPRTDSAGAQAATSPTVPRPADAIAILAGPQAGASERLAPPSDQPRVARAEPAAPAVPLAQTAEAKPAPAPASSTRPGAAEVAPASSARARAAEVAPSFSCEHARTRSEKAVCGNAKLATLDRSVAMLYSQSYGPADSAKRPLLVRARERFLARRDDCRSDSCVSEAYLGHMREISDIMRRAAEASR